MARTAPWRGVVEGYYGRPWPGAARRDVIRFLAARGMNAFVYGPKHDPWHRARWREPYPDAMLADLAATAAVARASGVRFVWAIGPALDVRWSSVDDEAALCAKLAQMAAAGIPDAALFFDDVPEALTSPADVDRYGGSDAAAVGRAHADLANRVQRWLLGRGQPGVACLVPSDYTGTSPTPYLAALGAGLAPGVPVGWTGPAVLATTIDAAAARARRDATGGHPIALWDNYPVNDVVLANSLHLGPLTGRDPALPAELDSYLLNPMRQPYASLVALATAADYLRDPAAYDPESSWHDTLAALDGGGGLGVLAGQLRSSALAAPDYVDARELAAAVDRLATTWPGPDWPHALDALEHELRRQAAASGTLAVTLRGTPLGEEIAPWAAELAAHAAQGLEAAALLRALRPRIVELVRERGMVRGRALPPDAGRAAGLGPRFADPPAPPDLATYLSALGDFLGPDPALPAALGLNVHGKRFYLVPRSLTGIDVVSGRNVHDRFLGFVAEAWRRRGGPPGGAPGGAPVPLSLEAGGRRWPLDDHGRFAVPCGPGPLRLVAATPDGAATAVVVT